MKLIKSVKLCTKLGNKLFLSSILFSSQKILLTKCSLYFVKLKVCTERIITISLEVCVPVSHTQSPNLHSPNHCPREASLLKLQQQLPTPRCEVRWFHPGLKRSGLAQSGLGPYLVV